ncbi:hypothetical protein D9Q98_009116 [Chlorella vulgaris]|uniref:Uncharacterized protein n=1 Tax=Chlorella vulgaris TaxID=3077 RepID=A0A9D4TH83_CHLVU|nr:hypothetical protein D9Q98_009116 [Chlorella vulgaris]
MLLALQDREAGLASLEGAAAFGHRPHRFHTAALGDAGLAQRLKQTAALAGHSGAVNTLTWTDGGELLASGGEDCRLRLWRGAGHPKEGSLLHSLDTGHTASILCTRFLPAFNGDQLISCSADRQIRHLNVTKGAVRPYLVHQGRVRTVVPLDSHVFLSASEDGTVREFDVRQRPAAVHREALAGDDSNVLVDQRQERVGRQRVKVGIYSLAVDEQRPWMMLTGGTDPLMRLYDRRMLVGGGTGGAAQWMACYAPSHIKAALWDSGRHPGLELPEAGRQLPAGCHVTSVAFARGGSEVVASYSGELIYSFGVAAHARAVEALLHMPDTVIRAAAARHRSHTGRRSVHGYAASQQQQQQQQQQQPLLPSPDAQLALEGGGGTAPPTDQPPAAVLWAQAAQQQAGLSSRRQLPPPQQQRAVASRGIAIAQSVRQLEQQRRQQSRVAAAAGGGEGDGDVPRAESSRPAHWQLHPTSSTLRSPHNERRQGHVGGAPSHNQQQQQEEEAEQQVGHPQSSHGFGPPRFPHELVSDSEGLSDGFSLEGGRQPRQLGVRRSRRIMRRRRDAADAAELQLLLEDAAAEAAAAEDGDQQQREQQQQLAQQPAVSGVAEPASSSDGDRPDQLLSPTTTRGRRVRRRTIASCAAADDKAAAAAAAAAQLASPHRQGSVGVLGGGGTRGTVAAGAAEAADGRAAGGDGCFKAPAGRSPQRRHQTAATANAAANAIAAAAAQRLDSTLGLLHLPAAQLEASEVAAGGGGGGGCWEGGTQHGHQAAAATVSMRHGGAAGGVQAGSGGLIEQTGAPAVEVSSRPLPSASQGGLGTQLGSQQAAGHEASSLNSAEQPEGAEHVGSVAQRPRDAPSVGNAPLATTAAAPAAGGGGCVAAAAAERRRAAAEAREASTGHNNQFPLPPPPLFAQTGETQQQQQQQQLWVGGPRPQLQPTASTGTSRPPTASATQHQHQQQQPQQSQQQSQQQQQQRYLPPHGSARQASRLRRHSACLEAAAASGGGRPLADSAAGAAAAAADGFAVMGSSQVLPAVVVASAVAAIAAELTAARQAGASQEGQQADQQQQQQQQEEEQQGLEDEPQVTMLSGRGPSVLGEFMPGQDQPTSSEIQQRPPSQPSRGNGGGSDGGGGDGGAERSGGQRPPQQQQLARQRRRQVESALGAIVHGTGADDGEEEVSEPLMYSRCFAGHLNLAPIGREGLPLAPQLAFMGSHSELLVSPSDDGNVLIWHYASGRLVAVLPPVAPAASDGASGGGGPLASLAAAAAAGGGTTCVAPHPLLPMLASAGMDSSVRLWSPEAAQQSGGPEQAAAAVRSNLEQLAAGGWQQPASASELMGGLLGSRRAAPSAGTAADPCNTV